MTNLELIDRIRTFIKEHSYNRYESFSSDVCKPIIFVEDIEKFLKELESGLLEEIAKDILEEFKGAFKRLGE